MLDKLKPYAKAIVAALLLVVFVVGSWLGVDTGIDPEAQLQAILLIILGTLGVYATPNKSEHE